MGEKKELKILILPDPYQREKKSAAERIHSGLCFDCLFLNRRAVGLELCAEKFGKDVVEERNDLLEETVAVVFAAPFAKVGRRFVAAVVAVSVVRVFGLAGIGRGVFFKFRNQIFLAFFTAYNATDEKSWVFS